MSNWRTRVISVLSWSFRPFSGQRKRVSAVSRRSQQTASKSRKRSTLICIDCFNPEARVRFPALPDFLTSSGSGTGSTQPREYNWGATWQKSCLENRWYGRRDPSRWPSGTLYPQKLANTSPTSGGRSVSIVPSRTQTMQFVCLFVCLFVASTTAFNRSEHKGYSMYHLFNFQKLYTVPTDCIILRTNLLPSQWTCRTPSSAVAVELSLLW
jgi:hypothetical protein